MEQSKASLFLEALPPSLDLYPEFIALAGITGAVLLSQILAWDEIETDGDGWLCKTQEEITQCTGLTRVEQETARRTLHSINVLDFKKQGMPSRLYYRINHDALAYSLLGGDVELSVEQLCSHFRISLKKLSKQALARAERYNAIREFVDYEEVLRTKGNICHCCGQPVTKGIGVKGKSLAFDHKQALVHGGAHLFANLFPVHAECNFRKSKYERRLD